MIDAAIAASVKRIIPSEFSTNIDSPLSRKLPIVVDKVEIRQYLISATSNTSTTWTSINNGPFFDVCLRLGGLGPSLGDKKATFHNGGDNLVGTSRLSDIATAVVKILDPAHFEETTNQPVYIYSAAITERYLTRLVSTITGIDFGTVEDGKIVDLDVDTLARDAAEKLEIGDKSAMFGFYFQMMYAKGYGGIDFKSLSWNDRLGIATMTEKDIEDLIKDIAKELGIL